MKLTVKAIENLKPRATAYDVRGGHGFAVRVLPSGTRMFSLIYTYSGQKKRLTFGKYPDLSLADAADMHRTALSALARGKDPGAKQTTTVCNLAGEYMERWAKKRKKSWAQDQRNLDVEILPKLGKMQVDQVTRRNIRELVQSIEARPAPILANRVLSLLKKMFRFAVEQDIIESTPAQFIRPPSPENKKDRALSDEEIKTLLQTLPKCRGISDGVRRALSFILITGTRPGEAAGILWDEIEGRWWTVPEERSKNGLAHRVYLTDLALETLPPRQKTGPVFPSVGGPLRAAALSHAVRNNLTALKVDKFTPHDLRRSCATGLARIGVDRVTISRILNHKEQGVIGVYDRHDYDRQKQRAMEKWAAHLIDLRDGKNQSQEGAEVIPIR